MTIPNVDGLSPGEITEMYSFDHDLGSFVAIGTGTVSKDGSVIKSDPGVGIIKGGWHCGGNPQSSGTSHNCPECKTCVTDQCQADSAQNSNACGSNQCDPFSTDQNPDTCPKKKCKFCDAGNCSLGPQPPPQDTPCDQNGDPATYLKCQIDNSFGKYTGSTPMVTAFNTERHGGSVPSSQRKGCNPDDSGPSTDTC